MQISENSIEHLTQWKYDIEIKVRNGEELWEDVYPLYSQISFWIKIKKHEICGTSPTRTIYFINMET